MFLEQQEKKSLFNHFKEVAKVAPGVLPHKVSFKNLYEGKRPRPAQYSILNPVKSQNSLLSQLKGLQKDIKKEMRERQGKDF